MGIKVEYEIGDCLEVLKAYPDDHFDSCVTDPPYGLAFMGKTWDMAEVGPFTELWAKEVLRVLKPGAHLLAFGGTRTYHRMVCALEDAGFEIRDCLMWLYGCLSVDTELLINGKWTRYNRIKVGDSALLFDAQTNKLYWGPVLEVYVYDYDDTAYRILSERTDQIVSRNHRVAVERDGMVHFRTAESLAFQRQVCIPILEGLYEMPQYLSSIQSHSSTKKQDLLTLSYSKTERTEKEEDIGGPKGANHQLCGMWQREVDSRRMAQENKDADLLQALQRHSAGKASDNVLQSWEGWLDRGEYQVLSREDVWSEESSVEGRGHDIQEARQLRGGSICEMPEGLSLDGSEGRLCNGASVDRGEGSESLSLEAGSGPSCQSYPLRQPIGEPRTLSDQSGAQARGARQWVSDVARIEPIHYKGIVWCIQTPTGAFVARRRGKTFITGNSGFPKSHDVSKAIDKALGVQRTVILQVKPNSFGRQRGGGPGWAEGIEGSKAEEHEFEIFAPATPEAQRWNGWGTALKPAYEPIVLARKPLEGTVAKNVLKYGTGGINVDGCRIETGEIPKGFGGGGVHQIGEEIQNKIYGAGIIRQGINHSLGRWPSNVLLDEESAKMLDEQSGESESKPGLRPRTENKIFGVATGVGELCELPYNDSGGASRFFYIAKASRSERERGLNDLPKRASGNFDDDGFREPGQRKADHTAPNPVANIHPTVKPLELMRYLVRLVTPKDGICLDPFLGSGTTLLACRLEGFNGLGIEKESTYEPIIRERLSYYPPAIESFDEREENPTTGERKDVNAIPRT